MLLFRSISLIIVVKAEAPRLSTNQITQKNKKPRETEQLARSVGRLLVFTCVIDVAVSYHNGGDGCEDKHSLCVCVYVGANDSKDNNTSEEEHK